MKIGGKLRWKVVKYFLSSPTSPLWSSLLQSGNTLLNLSPAASWPLIRDRRLWLSNQGMINPSREPFVKVVAQTNYVNNDRTHLSK